MIQPKHSAFPSQLIGLALVAIGSYLVHTGNSLSFFTGNHFFSGAAILIICGIAVFLITALGIGGAFCQSKAILAFVSDLVACVKVIFIGPISYS